jgi:hypothetical protein
MHAHCPVIVSLALQPGWWDVEATILSTAKHFTFCHCYVGNELMYSLSSIITNLFK